MEVYGSAETFWLLLKDHLLGSPEYVSLIENYDIDFKIESLHDVSSSSIDLSQKPSTRNSSLTVRPDFQPEQLLVSRDLRKSVNESVLRDSNVQVMWENLDLEVSFEDNSYGCIRIDFNKKRNKKWKTLVSKRLREVMDIRISLTHDQVLEIKASTLDDKEDALGTFQKKYNSTQIEYWRSVTNLKKVSLILEKMCEKNILTKYLWIAKKESAQMKDIEARNQKLKSRLDKGRPLLWRKNFLHHQMKRQEMGLSRNFYNGLKVLVFTDFPDKVSKVIQNDLKRVRR